jgi:hypothetical protein
MRIYSLRADKFLFLTFLFKINKNESLHTQQAWETINALQTKKSKTASPGRQSQGGKLTSHPHSVMSGFYASIYKHCSP